MGMNLSKCLHSYWINHVNLGGMLWFWSIVIDTLHSCPFIFHTSILETRHFARWGRNEKLTIKVWKQGWNEQFAFWLDYSDISLIINCKMKWIPIVLMCFHTFRKIIKSIEPWLTQELLSGDLDHLRSQLGKSLISQQRCLNANVSFISSLLFNIQRYTCAPGHCQKANKFLTFRQSKDTPFHKTSCFTAHTHRHMHTRTHRIKAHAHHLFSVSRSSRVTRRCWPWGGCLVNPNAQDTAK